MANICEYRVKVKGAKNACYMDYKDMVRKSGADSNFELIFSGNCKYAVDAYCKSWEGDFPVKLPADADDAQKEAEDKYWYHTVQERSKMFDVEVWCNSCDIDGAPDIEIYEHYKNGEPVVDELPNELEIDGTSEIQNVAALAVLNQQMEDLMEELNRLENIYL